MVSTISASQSLPLEPSWTLIAYGDLDKTSEYTLTMQFNNSTAATFITYGGISDGVNISTLSLEIPRDQTPIYKADLSREQLLATIGSDTMESPARATEPKLVENINGTNTFTFKMYYTYFDFDLKKQVSNPFIKLLVNERKIKVLWKGKWYHLVIKNIQENTNGKYIVYTCKDQYINELGKVGYGVTLDKDLENNQGTVTELAKEVLKDTDWTVDEDRSDILCEKIEEPVIVTTTLDTFSAKKAPADSATNIPTGAQILVFYPQLGDILANPATQTLTNFQFAYALEYVHTEGTSMLVNADCYLLDSIQVTYVDDEDIGILKFGSDATNPYFQIAVTSQVSNTYRANRYVKSRVTLRDTYKEKYVDCYRAIADYSTAEVTGDETHYLKLTYNNAPLYIKIAQTFTLYGRSRTSGDLQEITTFNSVYDLTTYQYWAMLQQGYTSFKATLQGKAGGLDQEDVGVECDNIEYISAGNIRINTLWVGSTSPWPISISFQGNNLTPIEVVSTGTAATQLFAAGDTIYKYTYSKFTDPTLVPNLIVGSSTWSDTTGWTPENDQEPILFQYYPNNDPTTAHSYLRFEAGKKYNNCGLQSNNNHLKDGMAYEEIYVVRYKAFTNNGGVPTSTRYTNLSCAIFSNDKVMTTQESAAPYNPPDSDYTYTCLKCVVPFTRSQIYSKNIRFRVSASQLVWLQSIELFKYVPGSRDGADVMIVPGEMDIQSVYSNHQVYYKYTGEEHNDDTYVELYDGVEDPSFISAIEPMYNPNYAKIRSIDAKQSNCFNILQTLAEKFQCWARFDIETADDGHIKLDSDGNPIKKVYFKEEVGQDTQIGFIYGTDLRQISRTIVSDQIVTKTIVPDNTNSYGINGFCSIARASQNPARVNFILDFGYFVNQGLIDGNVLNRDLYDSQVGYYPRLRQVMQQWDIALETYKNKETQLETQKQFQTTYKALIDGALSGMQLKKTYLIRLYTGTQNLSYQTSYWTNAGFQNWLRENQNVEEINSTYAAIIALQENYDTYTQQLAQVNASIEELQTIVDNYKETIKLAEQAIKELHLNFYKKYSTYLQEGTWKSDDYMDDNMYYLDGVNVAYTSSRPQVQYNISVIRLTALEDYKFKIFRVGDISFVQDTEFFGYTYINDVKTPYKEKVLIAEVTSNFDEPEKDSFKIQNYKTQFEDLFQRITATTQQLKYAEGSYAKAAGAVTPTGGITYQSLQQAFANNGNFIIGAQNQSVVTDLTGLTVSDVNDPSHKTKITSGGIFITNDGGVTWTNAINSNGVVAETINSGVIYSNEVNIMDGKHPTFRWDSKGISAFAQKPDRDLGTIVNERIYTRHDQFGFYGVDRTTDPEEGEFNPTTEDEIWASEFAKFGFTWKGFFLKTKDVNGTINGSVEISSDNDISIWRDNGQEQIEQIHIGRLYDESNNLAGVGIRLRDTSGHTTLETDANTGSLWLQDSLSIGGLDSTTNHLVQIGSLVDDHLGHGRQVINASNKFIVYEDGTVIASQGVFNGDINATGGTIGGFTINDHSIASQNENLVLNDDGTIEAGNITIDGNNSNITIGDTITISGAAGNVCLHGEENGEYFDIRPTHAQFSNMTASGSIETVVFPTGNVQAMGSSMFFRPSFKVDDYVVANVTNSLPVNKPSLATDSYVYLIDDNGQVVVGSDGRQIWKVVSHTDDSVTFDAQVPKTKQVNGETVPVKVNSIVSLGTNDTLLIGVNANDTPVGPLFGDGFTFTGFEYTNTNNIPQVVVNKSPRLFLGDLGKIASSLNGVWSGYVSDYGLYGENVFLTGSLITKTASEEDKYAGVSTLKNVPATKFGDSDESSIVFWAGVTSLDDKAIQEAPFQVTQNGSIFAQQGIFAGSLITQSELRGVDIYAARIHGITKTIDGYLDYPGLSFYDIKDGISFYRNGNWEGHFDSNNNPDVWDPITKQYVPVTAKETFTIGTYGLTTNLTALQRALTFIEVLSPNDTNTDLVFRTTGLQMQGNKLGTYNISDGSLGGTYYQVNSDSLQGYVDNTQKLNITAAKAHLKTSTIIFNRSMTYQELADGYGYDLFVGEAEG